MRNGGLRIPSLMMSFGNGPSYKSTVFDIKKNNLFMGRKRPMKKIKALTPDQIQALNKTIAGYEQADKRQTLITLTLTVVFALAFLMWVF